MQAGGVAAPAVGVAAPIGGVATDNVDLATKMGTKYATNYPIVVTSTMSVSTAGNASTSLTTAILNQDDQDDEDHGGCISSKTL